MILLSLLALLVLLAVRTARATLARAPMRPRIISAVRREPRARECDDSVASGETSIVRCKPRARECDDSVASGETSIVRCEPRARDRDDAVASSEASTHATRTASSQLRRRGRERRGEHPSDASRPSCGSRSPVGKLWGGHANDGRGAGTRPREVTCGNALRNAIGSAGWGADLGPPAFK